MAQLTLLICLFACLSFGPVCPRETELTTTFLESIMPLIINGLEAKPEQFPEVVKLTVNHLNSLPGTDELQKESFLCTATYVSQTTLITAAHCFCKGQEKSSLTFDFESFGSKVKKIITHPLYVCSENDPQSNFDIAFIVLEDPVSTPFLKLSLEAPKKKTLMTMVGFGSAAQICMGMCGAGIKRYGLNKIKSVEEVTGIIHAETLKKNQKVDGKLSTIAIGDSGGPLIIGGVIYGLASTSQFILGDDLMKANFVGFSSQINQSFIRSAQSDGAVINFQTIGSK